MDLSTTTPQLKSTRGETTLAPSPLELLASKVNQTRTMKLLSNVLVAVLSFWVAAVIPVADASPFIMPATASRSASLARLAFTGRGGAASKKASSLPANELLDSITSGLGGKVSAVRGYVFARFPQLPNAHPCFL